MNRLTPTQAKALDFIRTKIEHSSVSPTLREICTHMGYSAIGSAQDVVSALRKKGFIAQPDKQSARSFILTKLAKNLLFTPDEGDPNTFVIPCLGTVPAGLPAEAIEEQVDTLRMSISLLPSPRPKADQIYGLRAAGESMVNAGILDGDWLVVKVANDAPKGSVIVARLGDDITVKRLMSDKEGWYLQPENPVFSPTYAKDEPFEVVGQVLALQRSF